MASVSELINWLHVWLLTVCTDQDVLMQDGLIWIKPLQRTFHFVQKGLILSTRQISMNKFIKHAVGVFIQYHSKFVQCLFKLLKKIYISCLAHVFANWACLFSVVCKLIFLSSSFPFILKFSFLVPF